MRRFFQILAVVIVLPIGVYFAGPRPQFEMVDNRPLPPLDVDLADLETQVVEKESAIENLKPDNQARIIWNDSIRKTEYAIVYLHGFSASPGEGYPIHQNIAKRYGANLYLARLQDHGIKDRESFVNLTPQQLVNSALEAVQIGKTIGEKVILLSCSTGSTLSIYLAAADPDLHSLLMFSPNIALDNPAGALMDDRWGKQLVNALFGTHRIFDTKSEYWTDEYHTNGLIAMQNLLTQTMTPEVFEQVKQPVFCGYYYKNEEEKDHIVSVDAMHDFIGQISTDTSYVRMQAFADATDHAMVSVLKNPNWATAQSGLEDFMENTLSIPAVGR